MRGSYSRPLPNGGFSPDVEKTIRDLTLDLGTAFNTGNYDQVASLFASESTWMVSHQETAADPPAIERACRRLGESGYQDLRLLTQRVDPWGDLALERGPYTVTQRLPNGATAVDRGAFMNVWRRLGAWRILASSWTTSIPRASAREQQEAIP